MRTMKQPKLKGMSLPLETVVLLILAAVVLAALLAFFLGTYTPAQSKVNILKQQNALCQQIFAADPQCRVGPLTQTFVTQLALKVCGQPTDAPVCGTTSMQQQQCVNECCRIFCPQ